MNLYHRIYHYIGQITLKNDCILKLERLPNEETDPWLFLVFDKKGQKRYSFFYKPEQSVDVFNEKSFNIQISFLVEGRINTHQIIKPGQIYDVWRGEEPIGFIKIIASLLHEADYKK
jgi:hypothetical protein